MPNSVRIAAFLPLILAVSFTTICILLSRSSRRFSLRQHPATPALPGDSRQDFHRIDDALVQYDYKASHYQGKTWIPASLRLQMDVKVGSGLFLSPELWGDRCLKWLRLSQESETADPELDQKFHIVAENPAHAIQWLLLPEVRRLLLEIAEVHGLEYFEIRPDSMQMYFSKYQPTDEMEFTFASKLLAEKLVRLAHLAQKILGSSPAAGTSQFTKRFDLYESPAPSHLFGLSLFVGVAFYIVTLFSARRLIHQLDDLLLVCTIMIACITAGVAVASGAFRKLQLPSKVFFQIFTGLFFLLIFTGMLAAQVFNMNLDHSPGTLKQYVVSSKYIGRHKSRNFYRVRFNAQPPSTLNLFESTELDVCSQDYQRIRPGITAVQVEQHPGALHLPWFNLIGFNTPP